MFDFFRDLQYEWKGIDSAAMAEQRRERKARQRASYALFSKPVKGLVLAFGVLFLLMAAYNIQSLRSSELFWLHVGKYSLLIGLDMAACILMLLGNRRNECIAAICIGLFMLFQYIFLFFL